MQETIKDFENLKNIHYASSLKLLLFLILSWGRGNPEQYTEALNLGGDDSRYDPMDEKKPRAGQILWIRGLTRLQTQVSYHKCLYNLFRISESSFLFYVFKAISLPS